jgi:hypothetical protein
VECKLHRFEPSGNRRVIKGPTSKSIANAIIAKAALIEIGAKICDLFQVILHDYDLSEDTRVVAINILARSKLGLEVTPLLQP